jgi:hypothetical protein
MPVAGPVLISVSDPANEDARAGPFNRFGSRIAHLREHTAIRHCR